MQHSYNRFFCLIILGISCFYLLSCRPFIAGGIYHEVRQGHTLYSISQTYGQTVDEIQKSNNLSGTTILPGQKLFIPRAIRTRYVHPVIGSRIYVRQRTSLEDIARQYQIDEDYLHRANNYPFWKGSVKAEEVFIPGLVRSSGVVSPAPSRSREPGAAVSPERLPFSIVWPVRGTITSTFQSRERPNHSGLDIAAPSGTPIKAAAAGTVVYSDNRISGYGNMVILKHQNNYFTIYAHNQRNSVKTGQNIRQGDIIGYVGMTGKATGPHLHFEIRHQDTPLDPQKYLP